MDAPCSDRKTNAVRIHYNLDGPLIKSYGGPVPQMNYIPPSTVEWPLNRVPRRWYYLLNGYYK